MNDFMEAKEAATCLQPSALQSPCPPLTISPSPTNNQTCLSRLESIMISHPPIFESFLLHLPTCSILDLYHTSKTFRLFLQEYPTAWKHLSFRSLKSDCGYLTRNAALSHFRAHALDLLLVNVPLRFGARLRTLELDNTSVSGSNLVHCVLHGQRDILQHLSVRGCKQVSLNHHIVPFLSLFKLQRSNSGPLRPSELALRSIYTFRCRHYRRRPYTPSTLARKDSDAAPVHDLVQLCHELGIWTDTAWCPTLGSRCLRRKGYSLQKGTPEAKVEVWVVYDRLWRSGNRLGPSQQDGVEPISNSRGQLWEDAEAGYKGEALGCGSRVGQGEGKGVPAHLRKSYRAFTDDIACQNCGIQIQERCEHCSISMHCTGCRKTFCESCAFSRSLPIGSRNDSEYCERFWWAPGATRSPNLMTPEIAPSGSILSSIIPDGAIPPVIKTQWCCLKPVLSTGGSISFSESVVPSSAIGQIRACPLPKGKNYEDPDFQQCQSSDVSSSAMKTEPPSREVLTSVLANQTLESLLLSSHANPCARNLCPECLSMPDWRGACQVCKEPFCFAHEFRESTKILVCGFRDLAIEKFILKWRSAFKDQMVVWERLIAKDNAPINTATEGYQKFVTDECFHPEARKALEAILPLIKWPLAKGNALKKEIDTLISQAEFNYPPSAYELTYTRHDGDNEHRPPPPSNHEDLSGTDDTKWQGCGAFLCPRIRPPGVHRPRCTAVVRKCVNCGVYVCPGCDNPTRSCDCSFCRELYFCPSCYLLPKPSCKKAEMEEEKRAREEADELVASAAEMMRSLGANGW